MSCQAKGRVSIATQIDHIIPLMAGGSNHPSNLQGLCSDCHKEKSALDRARYGYGFSREIGTDGWPVDDWHPSTAGTKLQAYSIPHYVKPSAIPVHLVCGPPGSGKSSYAKAHAKPEDVIIDFDIIRESLGASRYDDDPKVIDRAFKHRDWMIRSLAQRTEGQAWLVVMAPTQAERSAWAKALGSVTLHPIEAKPAECKERIANDPTREGHRDRLYQAVDAYFSQKSNG